MGLFILKTDVEKFTSTNKKTLHLMFNVKKLYDFFTTFNGIYEPKLDNFLTVMIYKVSSRLIYNLNLLIILLPHY